MKQKKLTTRDYAKELYSAYLNGDAPLTKDECESINCSMYFWQNKHCHGGIANYTTEQYNRALKKITIDILESRIQQQNAKILDEIQKELDAESETVDEKLSDFESALSDVIDQLNDHGHGQYFKLKALVKELNKKLADVAYSKNFTHHLDTYCTYSEYKNDLDEFVYERELNIDPDELFDLLNIDVKGWYSSWLIRKPCYGDPYWIACTIMEHFIDRNECEILGIGLDY